VDKAEFDRFAQEYDAQHKANIAITGETPEYFARYKIAELARIAAQAGIARDRIIDFGSGIGNSVPHFRSFFPGSVLSCADVSPRSLELAGTRFPGNEQPLLIEGDRIGADENSFDLAFSACVFHHIPHEEHVAWLEELRRVTKPGGLLAIFEHNPMNPLTLHAVNTCPFDINARLIRAGVLAQRLRKAGWSDVQTRYHLFFPRAAAALRRLEPALTWLPFGAQYSVTARKR
jgi:SAM-dependent methyltransferase